MMTKSSISASKKQEENETAGPNKALHLTAIPLRSIAAGELGR